jgi:leader peptidase (prepilin peptidase)/N-methyltransferase
MIPLGIPAWFVYSVIFIFGASVGSFLNVVIWRMPRRESIVRPPSHCPVCNARLTTLDLFPLFSFLFLRARCRHCGAPISWRYFGVELLLAAWFVLVFWHFGCNHWMWVRCVQSALFGAALVAIFFIDLEHYEIPHELSLFAIFVGLLGDFAALHLQLGYAPAALVLGGFAIPGSVAGLFGGQILFALIFLVSNVIYSRKAAEERPQPKEGSRRSPLIAILEYVLFIAFAWVMVLYDVIRGAVQRRAPEEGADDDTPAFGFGDVMLAAAIGANLGLADAGVAFFLALVIGTAVSLILMALRMKGLKSHVPFGPFLVVGAFLALFFAPQIIDWYLRISGLRP